MSQLAARDSNQYEPVSIPLLDILLHPWFVVGFIEASRGLPFHFFGDRRQRDFERDKWFYERGRRVAIEARGAYGRAPQLWFETETGRVINPAVISLAGAMLCTGAFT